MGLGSFGFVLGLPRSIRIGLRVKSFHGGILGVGVLACSCGLRRFPECPRLPQNLPYRIQDSGFIQNIPIMAVTHKCQEYCLHRRRRVAVGAEVAEALVPDPYGSFR